MELMNKDLFSVLRPVSLNNLAITRTIQRVRIGWEFGICGFPCYLSLYGEFFFIRMKTSWNRDKYKMHGFISTSLLFIGFISSFSFSRASPAAMPGRDFAIKKISLCTLEYAKRLYVMRYYEKHRDGDDWWRRRRWLLHHLDHAFPRD